MTTLLDASSWVCLVAGVMLCILGSIGLLRMPDFWTRAHSASVTDTMGAGLVLLGLMLQAGFTGVAVKLLMVLFFLYITGPAATHALCRAAHAHGVPFTSSTGGLEKWPGAASDSD